jgi:hypothetical protein
MTVNLPSITENPKAVGGLFYKMNRRIFYPIVGLLSFNLFLSSFVVYKEFDSVIRINEKLAKLEEIIEATKDSGKEEANVS